MSDELGPFPVDDFTLDQIYHALGAVFETDEATGELEITGADFTLHDYLDFLSGYDPAKLIDEGFEIEGIPAYIYPHPIYSEHDLIRALIDEIRRLRKDAI